MFYEQTPVKQREMNRQLVARYFTVKSTDCFTVYATKRPVKITMHLGLDNRINSKFTKSLIDVRY